MDSPTASPDDHSGAAGQANLLWNPEIEAAVDLWRRTGEYPFPELNVYPQPQWHAYSRVDLRLIYHISTVSSELSRHQVSRLTLWTEQMPKYVLWTVSVLSLPFDQRQLNEQKQVPQHCSAASICYAFNSRLFCFASCLDLSVAGNPQPCVPARCRCAEGPANRHR